MARWAENVNARTPPYPIRRLVMRINLLLSVIIGWGLSQRSNSRQKKGYSPVRRLSTVGACVLFVGMAGALPSPDSGGAGQAGDNAMQVPDFVLEDQHRDEHDYRFPRERVTVLLVADRKGSDGLEKWVRPLYERYELDIDLRGIAELSEAPRIFRGLIRLGFRQVLEYPVLMDWEGEVCEALNYPGEIPRVVVAAPDGEIALKVDGEAEPERIARVMRSVDALLETQREESARNGEEASSRQSAVTPESNPT